MKQEIIIIGLVLLLMSCFPGEKQVIDPADVTIGYIGCSNTRETVEGYYHTGGKKMWPYERRYGSGTVLDWSRNIDEGSKYWDVFDELLEKYPKTKTIWWELCIMDEDRMTSYEDASIILREIRQKIPEAVIYVSALADYTNGVCSITGTWGLEKAKELVQELDENNDDVLPGPILGPMTPTDTAEDGCHLSSPDGKRKLGNQMRLFFDAEEYSADVASIGYVGCSNTMQTVASYWFAGGRRLWAFNEDELHEYDSGAVVDWSKGAEPGNKFWKTFDRYLENSPNTNAIFWQLCIRKEEPTPYEEAVPILEAIRQRVPGAIIYVSALPPYTEGVCEITGTTGIERAKALAEELDLGNDDVIPGPVLGPMTPGDTDEDGCHLSEQGLKTLGQQMREFFDADFNNTNTSESTAGSEEKPAQQDSTPSPNVFLQQENITFEHYWPNSFHLKGDESEILIYNEGMVPVHIDFSDMKYLLAGKTYEQYSGTWEKFPSRKSWERMEYVNIKPPYYQGQPLILEPGQKGKLHWHYQFAETPLQQKQEVNINLGYTITGRNFSLQRTLTRTIFPEPGYESAISSNRSSDSSPGHS